MSKPALPTTSDDGRESRVLVVPLELRQDEGEAPVLEGYAAVFDTATQIGPDTWGFLEEFAKGAFAETIADDDIRALFNHDENQVLGRNAAKTLSLIEDARGLKVEITPPDTAVGRDVTTLVKRGDVSGMSISFRMQKEEWEEPDGPGVLPHRTIRKAQLFDVGPVTFPAYPTTSVAARSQAQRYRDVRPDEPATTAARERELAIAEAEIRL